VTRAFSFEELHPDLGSKAGAPTITIGSCKALCLSPRESAVHKA